MRLASPPYVSDCQSCFCYGHAEFSTELAMLLYNIMETVVTPGSRLDDYQSGSTLFTMRLFRTWIVLPLSYLRDTYITLANGYSMTIQDAIEATNATVGSNALKLRRKRFLLNTVLFPADRVQGKFAWQAASPTPSGDDDYVILDKFHEDILVSAPMLAMCTKFFEVVSQGEMD